MYDKLCVNARSMPFWCVGNPLGDPFGGPVQPKLDSLEVAQIIADAKQEGLTQGEADLAAIRQMCKV